MIGKWSAGSVHVSNRGKSVIDLLDMENPARALIEWYAAEGRALPWRTSKDPYRIWLSEVILQQTRIDQGTAYYLRFLERFPTVHDLAKADSDTVMKYWEGLGYYSRARNLHGTAKLVSEELGGVFPNHYSALMRLKGIGPYTARAIGSIAFGNAVGVLDGNVFRVLSRYLGDFSPIDLPATRTAFQEILDGWIQEGYSAADFNQGMMDLGAMVCTPRRPFCSICPLATHCVAYREGLQEQLPVKAKKVSRSVVYQHFFLVGPKGKIVIRRRPSTGLWAQLWEIPNVSVEAEVWQRADLEGYELLGAFKHVFTHLDMMIKVYRGSESPLPMDETTREIGLAHIPEFAFSRAVLKIFEQYLPDNL